MQRIHNQSSDKQHLIVDLGPFTTLLLCEIILILLKLTHHINFPWTLVLSPILLVILGSILIILRALFNLLRKTFF
jgi:hypothetical protein